MPFVTRALKIVFLAYGTDTDRHTENQHRIEGSQCWVTKFQFMATNRQINITRLLVMRFKIEIFWAGERISRVSYRLIVRAREDLWIQFGSAFRTR